MKHYASYRAKIRRMSDESSLVVPPDASAESLDSAQAAEMKPFYPAPPALDDEIDIDRKPTGPNPYKEYLRRRRRVVIFQIIVFVILAAVFTVWMIFLLRKGM